ncbi:MAG: RNA methyltransferase [Prolixibacteraceae bacterium]|jgi:TrmH family RNA methyltransferase|nr:RNA methyltransferase [Prolixibacteraceae bacterium]
MLSKNKIKFIQSLSRKKIRDEKGLFIAEGEKLIDQLIDNKFNFQTIIYTEKYEEDYPKLNCEKIIAEYSDIKKASSLKTPQEIIAICYQPKKEFKITASKDELSLVLDDIQDPGNLGTIIRIASWFGIKQIVCSMHTADCYNSKVIQATMGAISTVSILYTKLETYLKEAQSNGIPISGTFLDGENIYSKKLEANGIIVMGNEGNGISPEIAKYVDSKLLIPSFAKDQLQVESLNVGVATAIICSEFRRTTS